MSRIKADCLLLIATVIWGFAFVAQKTAMEQIGPFTFAGLRFILSALVVLPFALREYKSKLPVFSAADRRLVALLGLVFFAAVSFQQLGIAGTSVTNAGFLTSLYVVIVPVISLLALKKKPHPVIWFAAPLCLLGVFLLGDGNLTSLRGGDFLVILCAAGFAFHFILVAIAVNRLPCPLTLAVIQYVICGVLGLAAAFAIESISWDGIIAAAPALLYAGILSGGIAYTFQFIGQQYTPASDAAVILSAEALFAALGGVLLMHDQLSPLAWAGCVTIFTAIMLVELFPLLRRR